tara:strand:- start:545 stop:802 length:258 start_codon:yes stop_codon:yes gene_type:complete
MDNYTAIGIAEGFIETDDQGQLREAWQHLINTGLCWQLQGWFGRNAMRLINEGLCDPPPDLEEASVQEQLAISDEEAMWKMWGDQ